MLIYRILATEHPDAYMPDLATSFNALANALGNLGRSQEALETAEKALHIHEALAKKRPDIFLPNLAMSLSNLSGRLIVVGSHEEALKKAEDAVRIRDVLAKEHPDIFLPDMARSHTMMAHCLMALGRPEEALESSTLAVKDITQPLLRLPESFAGLALAIVHYYLEIARLTSTPPDMELLIPLLEVLQALEADDFHGLNGHQGFEP